MDDNYGDRSHKAYTAPVNRIRDRRITSFNAFDNYFHERLLHGNNTRERLLQQPHFCALRQGTLPQGNKFQPTDGICARLLESCFNKKDKAPINCGAWRPNAQHLIVGKENGDLMLWEGETFRYGGPTTVSKVALRVMAFNKPGNLLVTGKNFVIVES